MPRCRRRDRCQGDIEVRGPSTPWAIPALRSAAADALEKQTQSLDHRRINTRRTWSSSSANWQWWSNDAVVKADRRAIDDDRSIEDGTEATEDATRLYKTMPTSCERTDPLLQPSTPKTGSRTKKRVDEAATSGDRSAADRAGCDASAARSRGRMGALSITVARQGEDDRRRVRSTA